MEYAFINSMEIYLVAILVGLLSILYAYFHNAYQYWTKKGVPFLKPTIPRGNLVNLIADKTGFGSETKVWYDKLKQQGHKKYGGVWLGWRPALVVLDPEYVKDILSRDFHYFSDRYIFHDDKNEPIFDNLLSAKTDKWKPLRQKLTPTFSSGKIKMMFDTVVNYGNNMTEYLKGLAAKDADIEIQDVLALFTTDVIGSVAYGLECNSFVDPNGEFRTAGRLIEQPHTSWRKFKLFLFTYFPKIPRILGLRRAIVEVEEFFTRIAREAMQYREENNINRPDFLQLLIDLKNKTEFDENPLTLQQFVSNIWLFFVAGFDTSSTTMSFTLFELARHPEIQEKVRKDIKAVLAKHDGQLTYDSLGEMTYLSQVIDETTRMYPAAPCLGRVATKDYQLRDTDITIDKGTPIAIPSWGIQMDPNNFPEPEKFDPERFSQENKGGFHPFAFLPFGEGQRNCIGRRFGLMQTKIGLISVLNNFEIKLSPKQKLPLTMIQDQLLLKPHQRLYVKAKKLDE